MWEEDNRTRSKLVMASPCYFPSDLPEVVSPTAPERNEVHSFFFLINLQFFSPCVYACHGGLMWTICLVDEGLIQRLISKCYKTIPSS